MFCSWSEFQAIIDRDIGETLSFDHSEYYLSCARTKTYDEHVALKDYKLEHTKPLFNNK